MRPEERVYLESLNSRLSDLCSRISNEARNYSLLLKQEEYKPSSRIKDYRIYCAFQIYADIDSEGLSADKYLLMQFGENLFETGNSEMNPIAKGNGAYKWLSYLRSKGMSFHEMLSIREITMDMFVYVRRDLKMTRKEMSHAPSRNDQRREAMPASSEQTVV
jgi:hypothetical protein